MKAEAARWPSPDIVDSADKIQAVRSRTISELTARSRYIFDLETIDCSGSFQTPAKDEKFNFTMISPNLPISFVEYSDSEYTSQKDKRRELYLERSSSGHCILGPSSSFRPQDWFSHRKEELLKSLKAHNSDIVLFPEFAFPQSVLFQSISPEESEDVRLRMRRTIIEHFEDSFSEAESNRNPFTFLGSYHCRKTFYHYGVILPNGNDYDTKLTQRSIVHNLSDAYSSSDVKVVQPPIFNQKIFPARRAGEQINVPTHNKLRVYRKPFGNVVVLICSDALDLNQITAIVNHNRMSGPHRIDYILCPSFNRSPQLLFAARELSFLASCMVLVCNVSGTHVNYHGISKELPSSKVYVCGNDFSRDTPRGDRVTDEIASAIGVNVIPAEKHFYDDTTHSENPQRAQAASEYECYNIVNVEVDYHKFRAFSCWSSRRITKGNFLTPVLR